MRGMILYGIRGIYVGVKLLYNNGISVDVSSSRSIIVLIYEFLICFKVIEERVGIRNENFRSLYNVWIIEKELFICD